MNVAANAQLHHIKLAFENAQSHHFAHNDIVRDRMPPRTATASCLAGRCCATTPARSLTVKTPRCASTARRCRLNQRYAIRAPLEHNKGYCNSRQLHKTIVSDKGRAVFNGLINVAQHAIKTDGQMTNNNLLLGRLAEVDTKPQLEIYADDVKCSHGATVGRIDDEQMFYLRSRGIDQQAAQKMIIYAFAAELTEALHDGQLKLQVLDRIGQRLPGGEA